MINLSKVVSRRLIFARDNKKWPFNSTKPFMEGPNSSYELLLNFEFWTL